MRRLAAAPSSIADALFGKARKAVLSFLYAHPERTWHLRELAREAHVSPTMLSKEVGTLALAGIVLDERDGNRRQFRANPACPIYDELRGIARKTAGLADILRDTLAPIPGVRHAFVFGSVARGDERGESDVDLCVVGQVSHRALTNALGAAEIAVGRPVNPVLYTLHEIRDKVSTNNPFVTKMLSSAKLFLIGDSDGLARDVGKP